MSISAIPAVTRKRSLIQGIWLQPTRKLSLRQNFNQNPTCLSQESDKLIMSEQEKTTAQKKNAYKIRIRIDQMIFRELLTEQGGEVLKGTVVGSFDRPLLSALANIATTAIMKDPRLNVVLRKG